MALLQGSYRLAGLAVRQTGVAALCLEDPGGLRFGPARSTGGGRWKPASGQRGAGRAMVWYRYRYRWPTRWPRSPPTEGRTWGTMPAPSGNGVRKMRSRSSVVVLICDDAAVVMGA